MMLEEYPPAEVREEFTAQLEAEATARTQELIDAFTSREDGEEEE